MSSFVTPLERNAKPGRGAGRLPWYGPETYLGLHVDFHASAHDDELGLVDVSLLEEQLRRMGVDYVQIDSKGGNGLTSWNAKTPGSAVCPVLKGDLVAAWREATRRLGIPLHAHWLAFGDKHLIAEHPDWRRVGPDGTPDDSRICFRSPYVDRYMIPQLIELVGDWRLDGVWIDGEAWEGKACYCPRCVAAWREAKGTDPPRGTHDDRWSAWMMLNRRDFDNYVNHYADALHDAHPYCRICDNWSLTLSQPGEPSLHVDFISSDDAAPAGLDNIRVEARFVSTRGLPWDFMQWLFYGATVMHDRTMPQSVRPIEHILQEAAYVLALGGNHQIYENPSPRRHGGLIDWRVDRIAKINSWCRRRQALCQRAESWEDAAVLVSESHYHRHAMSDNLLWSFDMAAVRGAVSALIGVHRSVDVVDEWRLRTSIDRYRLLVVPEQPDVSPQIVDLIKSWVARGGCLLISGSEVIATWGADFVGAAEGTLETDRTYRVAGGDGSAPIWSRQWRMPGLNGAVEIGKLSLSDDRVRDITEYPAGTTHAVSRGRVVWLPYDAFVFFERSRYALLRQFLGDVIENAAPNHELRVTAPQAVEAICRRRGSQRIVHLINRSAGSVSGPGDIAVEQILPAGPVEVEMRGAVRPTGVAAGWEGAGLTWSCDDIAGKFVTGIRLDLVRIHEAIVMDFQ